MIEDIAGLFMHGRGYQQEAQTFCWLRVLIAAFPYDFVRLVKHKFVDHLVDLDGER